MGERGVDSGYALSFIAAFVLGGLGLVGGTAVGIAYVFLRLDPSVSLLELAPFVLLLGLAYWYILRRWSAWLTVHLGLDEPEVGGSN